MYINKVLISLPSSSVLSQRCEPFGRMPQISGISVLPSHYDYTQSEPTSRWCWRGLARKSYPFIVLEVCSSCHELSFQIRLWWCDINGEKLKLLRKRKQVVE